MPYTSEEQEAVLRRILQPPTGSVVNAVGIRGDRKLTPKFLVSRAFHVQADLFYSSVTLGGRTLREGLENLRASYTNLLQYLREAGRESRFPAPQDLLDNLRVQGELLSQVSPEELLTSPLYQTWLRESEKLLRGPLSESLDPQGVVVPPAEARKRSIALVEALEAAVVSLGAQVERLATARSSFDGAPRKRALQAYILEESQRAIAIQQERLKRGGPLTGEEALAVLGARAALKQVETSDSNPLYYPGEGTLSAEPTSDTYPADPPHLVSLAGPYRFPEARSLQVQLGKEKEVVQIDPTGTPSLYATTPETFTWVASLSGDSSSVDIVQGVNDRLHLYLEAAAVRYDASVTLPAGSYDQTSLCAAINAAWSLLGVSSWLVANPSPLTFTASGGATFALGSGSINADVGLSSGGGFLVTADTVGSFSSAAEPFDLSSSPTLLLLATHSGVAYLVEVTLALGGSASAADVAGPLNARLEALGIDSGFHAFSGSGTVDIQAVSSAYRIQTLPCTALSLLGLTGGEVAQGTEERRSISFGALGVTSSAFLAAGLYDGETLALLLEEQLGPNYSVTASGAPGARSLVVRFVGSGWEDASLAVGTSALATYLGFPPIESRSSTVSPAELAGQFTSRSRLLRASVTIPGGEERTLEVLRDRAGFWVTRTSSTSTIAPGSSPSTLQVSAPNSGVLVGEWVILLSGANEGSSWQVTEVSEEGFLAAGSSSPVAGVVRWSAGPALSQGDTLIVQEGPLAGTFTVTSLNNPIEAQTSPAPSLQGTAKALVGPGALLIEGVTAEDLILTSDKSFPGFLTSTILTTAFYRKDLPASPWLRSSIPLKGAKAGDFLERRSFGTLLSQEPLLEVHENGAVFRTQTTYRPGYSLTLSTKDTYAGSYRLRSYRYEALSSVMRSLRLWQAASVQRSVQFARFKQAFFGAYQRRNPTPGMIEVAASEALAFVTPYLDLVEQVEPLEALGVDPAMDALLDGLEALSADAYVTAVRGADFTSLFDGTLPETPVATATEALRELMIQISRSADDLASRQVYDTFDPNEDLDEPDDEFDDEPEDL